MCVPRRGISDVIQRLLHPQRKKGIKEFLARPTECLAAPCSVSHLAFRHDVGATARVEAGGSNWEELDNLCSHFHSTTNVERRGRALFRAQLQPGFWCRWELYDTFHSYTFFSALPDQPIEAAFESVPLRLVPTEWLESLTKGSLISASHLEVRTGCLNKFKAEYLASFLAKPFEGRRIYASELHSGTARAFTDFLPHQDGFSRIIIQDTRLKPQEVDKDVLWGEPGHTDLGPGLLLQQLLALELYRSLSLNAEPWAGHMSHRVEELNKQHVQLMQQPQPLTSRFDTGRWLPSTAASKPKHEKHSMLDDLCRLHHQLEQLNAKYKPRLERARVWYQHICDLMGALQESPLPGAMRIGVFTKRRLEDLERDRRSVERETAELSIRLQRSVQLFDTQVAAARLEASHLTARKVERLTLLMCALSMLLGAQELHALAAWLQSHATDRMWILGGRPNSEFEL